jgi:hypothetical protein
MWEAIGSVFTSSNGPVIGLLLLIIIALIVLNVRSGHLRIRSEHVAIGTDAQEKERNIIRNQSEWLEDAVYAYENQIPGHDTKGYNAFRGKYILEICYKEMLKWILYNHIEESSHYIEIKQKKLWNIILQNVVNEEIKTEDFKDIVYDGVRDIIHNLIKIRKTYK